MGIINGSMKSDSGAAPQPDTQPAAGQPATDQQTDEEEGTPATEEEQRAYESAVHNAGIMIYGKGGDAIVNMVKNARSVPEGVAIAANMIVGKIYDASQKQGAAMADDVIMEVAKDVISMIYELVQHAGIISGEPSDDDLFTTLTAAFELWSKSHPGMIDAEDMKAGINGMSKDQLGTIAQQMMGGGDVTDTEGTGGGGTGVGAAGAPAAPVAGAGGPGPAA